VDSERASVTELHLPDSVERDDLGAFTARIVRLDHGALVRLRAVGERVVAWAPTPFDVLATRAVRGELRPADVTVSANELLATLTVVRGARVEPGSRLDEKWLLELPPADGWRVVDDVPAAELDTLAEQGIALAKEHGGPHGTPPSGLLDQTVLTVASSAGMRVRVPLRCLFALSGMGFLGARDSGLVGPSESPVVRVSATDSWLRLDARYGAVVRRRHALLPLVF
jgi:hypothetical protein